MQPIILYLGLDVHKDSITIAVAQPGPKGEIRLFGSITNDLGRLEHALGRIRKAHPGAHLELAYEAGPCGFVLARRLKQLKVPCLVAAPSLIPKQPGAPFKTDKRDARAIARLLRAGELTAVYVPEPTDEAIRDLCRARTDAVDDLRRCRHRLKGFLLRHGYRYQGRANWSQPHMRYLRELVLPHPAMKTILEEYLQGIDAAHQRVQRIEASMLTLLNTWRLQPAVAALMAFRGFQLVAAMVTVSELGDIHRFAHPRQLMTYLGLVPTESSSGPHQRQGKISRCGNGHQRWLLTECAEHYALPPKVSKELSRRQEGQSPEVCALSWKAQNRLHTRFSRLLARRLPRNKAKVALARELCGFLWALLRTQNCYTQPSTATAPSGPGRTTATSSTRKP
ncbi:MAG TPA: IS110 family transposase [Candidatus Methylomirabilis sp.]|nr:IS110 family transposase [Candidatus Methylomirabilis sp.]